MSHTLTRNMDNRKVIQQNLSVVICCLFCLSLMMIGSIDIAYCTDETTVAPDAPGTPGAITAISDAVVQMTSSIYGFILSIITPISACCFAVAGIMFFLGGKNGTEKARVLAISGVVGILIVVFAPLIAGEVASWVAPFANSDLSQFNPF